jgi:hypothetical protein
MSSLNGFLGRGRDLLRGAVIVAALALVALTQTQQAEAQAPPIKLAFPQLTIASADINYFGGGGWSGLIGPPGYYLVFVVKNIGADAGPFTVQVRTYSGVTLESHPLSGMKANGGRMFWHRLPEPPYACFVAPRTIVVDSANQIPEVNEADNVTVVNDPYPPQFCDLQ